MKKENDLGRDGIGALVWRMALPSMLAQFVSVLYSIVDRMYIGHIAGVGETALAGVGVCGPVVTMVGSAAVWISWGASPLMGIRMGEGKPEEARRILRTGFCMLLAFSLAMMALVIPLREPMLRFFGASDALLPLAQRYLRPIKYVFPLFLFNQMLSAFLRNDGNPGLATLGVLSGGVFNVFGDYFFVFTCDMGIYGAGLATAMGCVVSLIVLLTHFKSRKNTLCLVKPDHLPRRLLEISVTGFSSFFIDVAMGILTVLFNRQIMKYLDANALAVYGPIINISTFVQCCAYSVGQASQPIISTNFGAGQRDRIRETLRLALITSAFFGVFWTALSLAWPNLYIRIFMKSTPEILDMAPAAIRAYALSFLLLPFNIYSTYYFQAIMKPGTAFVVSVARGLVVSGALILTLPALAGAQALWLTMPITELLVMFYAAAAIRKYTRAL